MLQAKNNPLPARRKLGITRKIMLFFCLITSLIMFAGIATGYFFSSRILHDAIGTDYEKMAEDLEVTTSGLLDIITEHVKVYLTNTLHIDAVVEANKKYAGKDADQVKQYLLEMDKRWVLAVPADALVSQYTQTLSAVRLNTITKSNKYIAELFTTDKFGGLVATSGKTSDFYQADEVWWQKTYNHGKGNIYISDAEYDDSAQTISLTVALPIKDAREQIIGICKAVIKTDALFATIGNFKIDKTGHALLVNDAGMVIFHNGIKPLSKTLCDLKEFRKIVSRSKKHAISFYSNLHSGKQFTAFAVVKYPLLLENGIIWRIFIDEDLQEVFLPINHLFSVIAIIILALIIIFIPVISFFSHLFVSPLAKLRTAVEHAKLGDFNYPINIKTGDEIEWLADSFTEMSKKLSLILDNLENEIAAHQKTEETLKTSEANYQTIFESANDALAIRDVDTHKITNANQKACEMLCYSREEILNLDISAVNAGYDQYPVEKLENFFQQTVTRQSALIEWPLKDKFGRVFWAEASLKKILIKNRHYVLIIFRDITERKQLLEQKETFMSTVSHELRTPLAAIKESIALSLEEGGGTLTPKQKELLSIAKNNVDRLTKLINQVLDIQRLGASGLGLNIKENNINKTIEEVYRSMASLAAKKKINFVLALADNLPGVKFDQEKIAEVLINLLNNALKFTEAGTITITSAKEENYICVAIKDTGIGIKTEDIPKLFQRFIQLARTVGGSGLGLFICKEIIEIHQGKIWVDSVYGKGTTFYFTLPLN